MFTPLGRGAKPRSDLAVAVVLFTLAVMVAVAYLSATMVPAPLHEKFLPEHIAILNLVDNSAYSRAYRVGLAVLLVLTIAILARVRKVPELSLSRLARRHAGLLALAAVILLLAAGYVAPMLLAGSVALVLCGALCRRYIPARLQSWGAAVILVAYAVALSLRGLLRQTYLPDGMLSLTEWHYAATLAQGDRLAAGLALGRDVQLSYGLIPAMALGCFERAFGLLDFAAHIRLVQWSQIVYLLLAITALFLWKRNIWFVLFGALLIGPFVSTSDATVLFPNQAGWRSVGFPLTVVVLMLVQKWPLRRKAAALGLLSGSLLLFNPETGVPLAAAVHCCCCRRFGSAKSSTLLLPAAWPVALRRHFSRRLCTELALACGRRWRRRRFSGSSRALAAVTAACGLSSARWHCFYLRTALTWR